jgi:hypothetical protein
MAFHFAARENESASDLFKSRLEYPNHHYEVGKGVFLYSLQYSVFYNKPLED